MTEINTMAYPTMVCRGMEEFPGVCWVEDCGVGVARSAAVGVMVGVRVGAAVGVIVSVGKGVGILPAG